MCKCFWILQFCLCTNNKRMCYVIGGAELFNFSYGQATVFMGVGWVAGAPAAGKVAIIMSSSK